MNPWRRWLTFNGVGAIGMLLQLAMLAIFNRCMQGHYLYATAAALELTLLHNFAWHLRVTWRDLPAHHNKLVRLLRFHLSNGAVSLLGNLLLMRIFVQISHLPLLISNALAILCCSILNFSLGHTWVFAPQRSAALRYR